MYDYSYFFPQLIGKKNKKPTFGHKKDAKYRENQQLIFGSLKQLRQKKQHWLRNTIEKGVDILETNKYGQMKTVNREKDLGQDEIML